MAISSPGPAQALTSKPSHAAPMLLHASKCPNEHMSHSCTDNLSSRFDTSFLHTQIFFFISILDIFSLSQLSSPGIRRSSLPQEGVSTWSSWQPITTSLSTRKASLWTWHTWPLWMKHKSTITRVMTKFNTLLQHTWVPDKDHIFPLTFSESPQSAAKPNRTGRVNIPRESESWGKGYGGVLVRSYLCPWQQNPGIRQWRQQC